MVRYRCAVTGLVGNYAATVRRPNIVVRLMPPSRSGLAATVAIVAPDIRLTADITRETHTLNFANDPLTATVQNVYTCSAPGYRPPTGERALLWEIQKKLHTRPPYKVKIVKKKIIEILRDAHTRMRSHVYTSSVVRACEKHG